MTNTKDHYIACLQMAIRELIEAEWMVTCDWCDPEKRQAIITRCQALIGERPCSDANTPGKN